MCGWNIISLLILHRLSRCEKYKHIYVVARVFAPAFAMYTLCVNDQLVWARDTIPKPSRSKAAWGELCVGIGAHEITVQFKHKQFGYSNSGVGGVLEARLKDCRYGTICASDTDGIKFYVGRNVIQLFYSKPTSSTDYITAHLLGHWIYLTT